MISAATADALERVAAELTAPTSLPFLDQGWGARAHVRAIDQLGIVFIADSDGQLLHVNDELLRSSQYTRAELIGAHQSILSSGYQSHAFFIDLSRTLAKGQTWRGPVRYQAKDGSFFWVDSVIVPLQDNLGRGVGCLSVASDITRFVKLHVDLQARTRLLQSVLDNFPGGIAVFDSDLRMIVCNQKQRELLEYPDELFHDGPPTLEDLYRFNASRGEYGSGDAEEQVQIRVELARRREPHVFERRRPNGTHLEVRGSPLDDGGFVSTYLDITERKRDQELIARLAHHDALTGLPNRYLLRDRLESGLRRVERGEKLALHYLDLDRFKTINDTLGHPVGDALLQAVAERLKTCVRPMDTIARLGGDEFVVVQIDVRRPEDVETVAKRIVHCLSEPYVLGPHTVTVGASVGIALSPHNGIEYDELMKHADLALYRAKEDRGTYSFFEPGMDAAMEARRVAQTGLSHALKAGELELHYQPIIDVKSRKIISCEALIRWRHAERGLISADEVIPVAEETGLIVPIGAWLLQEACKEACNWPAHISVAVNVSAAQFRGADFRATVINALGALPPERLVLEITESLLIQNNEVTAATLASLRSLGIRFALDDFGTGYSSLSYLQSFPFDKLKVDRSFVSTGANERSVTLRRAIVQLAKALDMTAVAEGIETAEQFACIEADGFDQAQGFLLSRPVEKTDLPALFARTR